MGVHIESLGQLPLGNDQGFVLQQTGREGRGSPVVGIERRRRSILDGLQVDGVAPTGRGRTDMQQGVVALGMHT